MKKENQASATPSAALRARAEARLHQDDPTRPRESQANLKAAIHELEVHQVELEMQNEELRQAQVELAQARDRYSDLYDFAPVGYLTLSAEGKVLEANLAAAKMLGITRQDLVQRRLSDFVAPVSQDALYLHRLEVVTNEKAHACELLLRRADGTTFPVRLQGLPFVDASQTRRCHAALIDITEHTQAEAALREAKQQLESRVAERTAALHQAVELVQAEHLRFRGVLDQLPAYLVLLSPDYRVAFANRFFEERFGKSNGRRCYEYLFNRTEPCETCETFKVLQTHAPHRWEWTGPDGRVYDIYDFPFTDVDGSPLIMEVGLDITERRKAEAELARYREHLEDLVRQRSGELAAANAQLQAEVAERTRAAEALRTRNEELTRFNRAMVDRELRMIELKKEVNDLCARTGQPPRYPLDFEHEKV